MSDGLVYKKLDQDGINTRPADNNPLTAGVAYIRVFIFY